VFDVIARIAGLAARRPQDRSVWLALDGLERMPAAVALAETLQDVTRLNVFVTAADADAPPCLPPPLKSAPRPLPVVASLALSRLRACAVVAIGAETGLGRALLRAAAAKGAAALAWSGTSGPPGDLVADLRAATLKHPHAGRPPSLGEALARRAVGPGLPLGLEWLRLRKIPDVDALAKRLGRPRTILCLGNGPSSNTDAAVRAAAEADAVFRVNHRWRTEGRIRRADAAFTGKPKSALALPGVLVITAGSDSAARILRAHAVRARFNRLTLGVADDLLPGFADGYVGSKPTNGYVMLATALALKPRRLIVAGVDLFSHPEGAYPGDADTQNAYAPAHDAAEERANVLALLARQLREAGPEGLTLIGPLADIAAAEGLGRREEPPSAS